MLINTAGTIIRIEVAGTTLLSRITSGVKLIDLKENTKLISIAKVRKSDTILSEEVEELNEGSTTKSQIQVTFNSNGAVIYFKQQPFYFEKFCFSHVKQ